MDVVSRRSFLQCAGLGTLPLALRWHPGALGPRRDRPNVLFIMSDDHASHAIGCYGSTINATPNIDRLARDGVRFRNCFCTNSLCAPSRAVILTGKYSHRNGVISNGVKFDGAQQTLPKLLQAQGYETAIVGKWHLQSEPSGFDYSNILPGQGSYHDPLMIENGIEYSNVGYVTDLITDKALEWIEGRDSSRPFFLMLHHKAPHANWEPDEKHETLFTDVDVPLPSTFNDDYRTRSAQIRNHRLHVGPSQWELHFKRFGELPVGVTEQETREQVYQVYIKNYLRCVASVDDNIGRVLNYLDESGLSENTIVVYTSDQGFFLGDHGLYDKRFMYEESLRMPLLMRYPMTIPPGLVTDTMVLNLDFTPTFLDYANTPTPGDIQGESFRSVAQGETPANWRTAMYYRFYESAYGIGPHEGVRTLKHKLIRFLYGDMGWELYDLKVDPLEMTNVYEDPKYQAVKDELMTTLNDLRSYYGVSFL